MKKSTSNLTEAKIVSSLYKIVDSKELPAAITKIELAANAITFKFTLPVSVGAFWETIFPVSIKKFIYISLKQEIFKTRIPGRRRICRDTSDPLVTNYSVIFESEGIHKFITNKLLKPEQEEHGALTTTAKQIGLGLDDKGSPLSCLPDDIAAKITTDARDTDFLIEEKARKSALKAITSVLNRQSLVTQLKQRQIKDDDGERYANLAGMGAP